MTVRRFTITSIPPSVNAMYRAHGGGIIVSKPYRDWKQAAGLELMSQRGFDGDFIWRSDILFPCNVSGMDIDNAPKAIHDLLVKLKKVPDDRYLADCRIRWAKGDTIRVAVQIESVQQWSKVKNLSRALIKKLNPINL